MGFKTVSPGDCVSTLAQDNSSTIQRILDAPENRDLIAKRGNLSMLFPGDKVFIPGPEKKDGDGSTEQRFRAKVEGKTFIRVKLLDGANEPMEGVEYSFLFDDQPVRGGTTARDGIVEKELPRNAGRASLVLPWDTVELVLSTLAPANTVLGVQQRLANLGYEPGAATGALNRATRQALLDFQGDTEGLDVTGEPDQATIKALRDLHDGESLPGQEALDGGEPPAQAERVLASEVSVATSVADEMEVEDPDPASHLLDFEFALLDPRIVTWNGWLEIDEGDEPEADRSVPFV